VGLAIAATLAVAAAGLAWWRASNGTASRQQSATERIVETAVGARDSVRLPDGTRIVLAPASRLAIAAGYGAGAREVTLVGAASFEVRHDAAHPFVVHAGGAEIRDVGTAFTVRTDGVDATDGVAVAVREGSVSFDARRPGGGTASGGVVLAAGDRAELRANQQVVAMRGAASDADTAWMDGRLVYRGTPLAAVRADLRRWYGAEVRVADSALAARRLTATFENDPIADVLDVVARTLDARVERTGTDTFTLVPLGSRVR
jgi:transmembrane sensor